MPLVKSPTVDALFIHLISHLAANCTSDKRRDGAENTLR